MPYLVSLERQMHRSDRRPLSGFNPATPYVRFYPHFLLTSNTICIRKTCTWCLTTTLNLIRDYWRGKARDLPPLQAIDEPLAETAADSAAVIWEVTAEPLRVSSCVLFPTLLLPVSFVSCSVTLSSTSVTWTCPVNLVSSSVFLTLSSTFCCLLDR